MLSNFDWCFIMTFWLYKVDFFELICLPKVGKSFKPYTQDKCTYYVQNICM